MSKESNDYLKLLAAMEQAAAGLRPIAHILHSYFKALYEQGFTRPEALELAKDFQSKILSQSFDMFGKSDIE
jgi:hypothetical protein